MYLQSCPSALFFWLNCKCTLPPIINILNLLDPRENPAPFQNSLYSTKFCLKNVSEWVTVGGQRTGNLTSTTRPC